MPVFPSVFISFTSSNAFVRYSCSLFAMSRQLMFFIFSSFISFSSLLGRLLVIVLRLLELSPRILCLVNLRSFQSNRLVLWALSALRLVWLACIFVCLIALLFLRHNYLSCFLLVLLALVLVLVGIVSGRLV